MEVLEAAASDGFVYLGEDKSFQLLYDSSGMEEIELPEPEKSEPGPAFYWLQGIVNRDMVAR